MLALRLTRVAHLTVQLRRLLVAAASAGTGFLLLAALGYALSRPDSPAAATLRLAWCAPPLAATVHLAVAVAHTDPGTRPRPGLAAIGLGPGRLLLVSATTTALSCTLGSALALLVFLHLRGDLTGMPFDGAGARFLAADSPLPLPAALTLLSLTPALASATVALLPRPTETGNGPYGWARLRAAVRDGRPAAHPGPTPHPPTNGPMPKPAGGEQSDDDPGPLDDLASLQTPPTPPTGLPWGVTVLTAGLAVESYAGRTASDDPLTLPTALPTGPTAVLLGWTLTAIGLALAAPGVTHLCGRLVQAVRPGPLRLLAGRGLMAEAHRIGRPLGLVCAVAAAGYAMSALPDSTTTTEGGPLSALGATVVGGATLTTLFLAALRARQARADTTATLLRLGAPVALLRRAALLRAGVLLAVFGPLTLKVAELAALPLVAR